METRAPKQSIGSGTFLAHKTHAVNMRSTRPHMSPLVVCEKLSATAKVFCPSPPKSPSNKQNGFVNEEHNLQKWNRQKNHIEQGWEIESSLSDCMWSSEKAVDGTFRGAHCAITIPNPSSFIVRPSVPSPEDRYASKLPSGIVVQTTSGQHIEFWPGVNVPKSMFDISGQIS